MRRNSLARRAGAPDGTGLPRWHGRRGPCALPCPPPKGEIPFLPLRRTTNPSRESLDGRHAPRGTDAENQRRLMASGLPVSPSRGL
jgi:hypothetical protein